jgi:hypothetical protein
MQMMKNSSWLLAAVLGATWVAHGAQLISFPFNEGSGSTVMDGSSGLSGMLGTQQNPAVDYVQLLDASPSGVPGDRCITNSGGGFLMADDSATRVLDIASGPITLESWIFIDPSTPAKAAEGILAYGSSYKMGMRGGRQVFSLFGKVDITNSVAGPIEVGRWVHLAAAWEPGVGVHFFVDGTESVEANTNLTARAPLQNYLSLASEGTGNNSVAAFDRMRIHHALLVATEIDSMASNPKAPFSFTLASYDFNEAAFPCTNSVAPALPTQLSSQILPLLTSPTWSSDSPSGQPGDFSLGFLSVAPIIHESVAVPYGSTPIDLGVNNTNYTLQAWIKLPSGPLENRRVIFSTSGSAPRVSLSINATRGLHTTLYGNTDFASSVLLPNDNRWHHVAAVMEGFARVRFYLDGILRQTMNRTATGAASSSGTGGLSIGKESETLFFRGLLDRVTLNNDALTNSTLDYPAVPGLATFPALSSHPVDLSTNLGATVSFTAAPNSATPATYQWRYRTNLADEASVILPGQNTTTLSLASITAQHLGYYFLVITNAVGVSESYAAKLSLIPDLSGKLIDFEPPAYTSGLVENADNWTNDQNGNAARVLTASEISSELAAGGLTPGATVHSGNQALLLNGGNVATTTIRRFTGLENQSNVVFDVWVRPLAAGSIGTAIGNVFLTIENASGTRAAAFRFGPAFSIDYGSTNSGVWVASGLIADPAAWYHLAMRLDYKTRTYDFYVDDVKVNTSPIAFYTSTSESFRQVRLFRGANQAGMIVDDMKVPGLLRIRDVSVLGNSVKISWQGGTPPYQLQRRTSLGSGAWENVGTTTTATEALDTRGTGSMFYRLGSD